jgi:urease accessory protein
MYAATLQFDDTNLLVDGKARIAFASSDNETRLTDLYQRDPMRVLFPETPKDDLPQAVVVTTSGGLVGGDRITLEAEAGFDARAFVTSQAAEKIYRSSGEDAQINVKLTAGPESWLEYLPQETILFDGARLRRKTTVAVKPGARALAGEMIVFGRIGSGETFAHGFVHDAWDVCVDDRLTWADALHLDSDIAGILDNETCFNGAVSLATAIYAGPDAEGHLDTARQKLMQTDKTLVGATLVNGVLVMRWLGQDAFELRTLFGEFWQQFRHVVAGLPEKLPRLWHV